MADEATVQTQTTTTEAKAAPAAVAQSPAKEAAPETFSKEYVRELREENKGYRLNLGEEKKRREEVEAARLKDKEEAETRVKDVMTKADERIVRAELKSAALKSGMIDLDGLKLADMSKVKLNAETGEIEGADALMEGLKKSKPYLFGAVSTSSTEKAPDPAATKPKLATDMSPEEYATAKKKIAAKK